MSRMGESVGRGNRGGVGQFAFSVPRWSKGQVSSGVFAVANTRAAGCEAKRSPRDTRVWSIPLASKEARIGAW